MAKLMVRGYRPTTSATGDTGFALIGATQDVATVLHWIETTPEGLFLHTGFDHLKGEIIRTLMSEEHGRLIACAASRVVLADALPGKAWRMIKSREDGIGLNLDARHIREWYFCTLDATEIAAPLTNEVICQEHPKLNHATKEELWTPTSPDGLGSECLIELIKHYAEVPQLLGNKIRDDLTFQQKEHEFPSELRLAFAEIKFAKAEREAIEIMNSSGNIAQASLRLAKAIPAWVSQKMPFINTRLNNALAHGNINSLGELDSLTPEQLERLPNIGLKSIESLFQYLQKNLMPLSKNSLQAQSEHPSPAIQSLSLEKIDSSACERVHSLAESLEEACTAIDEIDQRQGFILRQRIKGRMLEDIAGEMGLTRERVRQISVKALRHFVRDNRLLSVARVESYLDDLYTDCGTTGDNFELLFRAVGINATENKAILNIIETVLDMSRYHLTSATINNVERILPIPNSLREIFKSGLDNLIAEVTSRIHSCTKEEAHLIANGDFARLGLPPLLASMLATEVVTNRMFHSPDGTVTGQANSAALRRQTILEFFRNRDTPANWNNEGLPYIEQRFPRPEGVTRFAVNDISDMRKSTLSSSDDYLFPLGYGDYGLWKHVPFNDTEAILISQEVSNYLTLHSERQFTDKDLLNALSTNGIVNLSRTDRRSKHYISAALFRTRHPKIRYMGRFTWCNGPWTDEPDTDNRLFISEIISDAIKDKGRPMWLKELRDVVISVRGHGTEFFQIIEKDGIVKLATTSEGSLYWDSSLDPYPLISDEAKKIQEEIIEILSRTPQMDIRPLKASISKASEWIAAYNDAEFYALALRTPGIEINTPSNGLSLRYSMPTTWTK